MTDTPETAPTADDADAAEATETSDLAQGETSEDDATAPPTAG